MKKYRWVIIFLNLIILLVYFNLLLVAKEKILKDGQLVLLELAPVDPRSLMQGDYMALRYKISAADDIIDNIAKRGYIVVRIDSNGVATKVRFQNDLTPLSKEEYLINYTSPNNRNVNIGAESFFFQEGQGEKYEKAKFGGIKIDQKGNSLLTGLYDEHMRRIE